MSSLRPCRFVLRPLAAALLLWPAVAPPATVRAEPVRAVATVDRFYALRRGALAWTGAANQVAYRDLVAAIRAADRHGLEPKDYHLAALARGAAGRADVGLDRMATDAWLTLAAHLLSGRLSPETFEPNWTAARRGRDLAAYLERALATGTVGESLTALAPAQPGYAALQMALADYRRIAAAGGWPQLDPGATLRTGDRDPRVVRLRERLAATGDLTAPAAEPTLFDAALADAVRQFQRKVHLPPDGLVGPLTRAELNIPVAQRIALIRANLERWRWMPDDLGRRHIRVNIADFSLEAHADGRVERTHAVIVGRLYRQTPVFSAMMTYLAFNPWWETPPSLAVKDKLPAFRRNPESVATLGFRVLDRDGRRVDPATIDWHTVSARHFPYRIRQAPGPQNALGKVKFMFPNRHNVYLHDTPAQGLFAREHRHFSSGCVRVQDALDLAAWVLAETPGWSESRIRALADGNDETRVVLAHAIPVHILYWTVVPDAATGVRFLHDIYYRDRNLIAALDR